MARSIKKKQVAEAADAQPYQHPTADLPARPEIGTQAHFKKSRTPATYRYDSSLAPELAWDGQNPVRERGEALIRELAAAARELADVAAHPPCTQREQRIAQLRAQVQQAETALRKISGPFLNWSGKAERLSFDVPTLPLFVHERLSTKAILDTLKGHQRDKQMDFLDVLFGSPERSLADQVLKAYEHRDRWSNRLILGDSLVAMNSLLRFENLGSQVQMIYMDPPYGVKFGSNFQPFVRRRDVKHNDDDDLTREPEMVQAYRDTWELGLHSYLTYLRDRLLVARELLSPSGSLFVQISDENLHHVRELMDEVFGAENFVSLASVRKTGGATSDTLPTVVDYLLWYAKDREHTKYRQLFVKKVLGEEGTAEYTNVELADGSIRKAEREELAGLVPIPPGARIFATDSAVSDGFRTNTSVPFEWNGRTFDPGTTKNWKTSIAGMLRLCELGRILPTGGFRIYKRYFDDFPYRVLNNVWMDLRGALDRAYVVQTATQVIERCLLMTTDPGDLVLDPTCGSGTTAYVAEQWGRRWITMDVSRVPLALARQRLLTATFPWHELKDEARGPAGGFVYKRRQNKRGEEIGGIVPHVTLKSIANDEPPAEEVLVDRPESSNGIVRVTGPFTFEATIPAAEGLDDAPPTPAEQSSDQRNHVERMIEVLRRAPVLRLPGNQTITLEQIRVPAKSLTLSAEAVLRPSGTKATKAGGKSGAGLDGEPEAIGILFGPEHGPLIERHVREAWDEAGLKRYSRLLVIGYGIDPKAREFVESAGRIGIPCVYLQATMDLQMGDLLKNMRSSQVFSVCGLPDVELRREKSTKGGKKGAEATWRVELQGLDTFDPATMEPEHMPGAAVPAWFLDTNYNGLVFRVRQAFFPRTGAWDNLKKSLKAQFDDAVWDHLAGVVSAPFPAGDHRQIAVKVIDPRGNELTVVKKLEEPR